MGKTRTRRKRRLGPKTARGVRHKHGRSRRGQPRHNKPRRRSSKAFVPLQCSPLHQDLRASPRSCYSEADLLELRDLWNARHADMPPLRTSDPDAIWQHLKAYYRDSCHKESCWVRKMTAGTPREKELLDAFAPSAPNSWKKNPNEWLSSLDILKVMHQYEQKYKCFDFLGPSPIDYDTRLSSGKCVWDELCHFRLQDHLARGHTKIGVIFNLDPHDKGGSHWVSLFINAKTQKIFYFDSAGEAAPPSIRRFADTVMAQGLQLRPPRRFTFDQNHPVEHQYGNTECGVYALFFLVHMLEDKVTAHYLKTHVLKDKYMERFRKVFFNEG